ncbi:MAG: ADP-ribosylglycohydrolase family protein [Bacteroidales bacterium]|nr:ADP-ribosylglycohydrolase family protein [Bacteroidales bacterium]
MNFTQSYRLPFFAVALCASVLLVSCKNSRGTLDYGKTVTIGKEALSDKIKGGWAGQTIGCTYGGPTEFKYKGGIIHDSAPLVWYDNYAYETFIEDPGLYDDVYMDITFAEVMARVGIDAPADSFALAFANADYKLWHANQAARYNILNGIMPPQSGHWRSNPHADDIDFQIEADFIGTICPAMSNTSLEFCNRTGHIFNYGDGWYGGVYLSIMYSLAFVTDDIPLIVNEALKAIPAGTKYRAVIEDVIALHRRNPNDWKYCWFEIEKKYGYEKGCPEGVFNGFNIDAALNSAYVVIGLLYGEGDFERTMDIATRCGQDSDCNPASAAGILGVAFGYEAIPDKWKPAIERVEKLNFPYTNTSLETMYELNMKLLYDVVLREGGKIAPDGGITVTLQEPQTAQYEQSFEGIKPTERRVLKKKFSNELSLNFTGSAIVVMGQVTQTCTNNENYAAVLEAWIDGKKVEEFKMPYDYIKRKYDIFYKYDLDDTAHTLVLKVKNPHTSYVIEAKELVVYGNETNINTNPSKL